MLNWGRELHGSKYSIPARQRQLDWTGYRWQPSKHQTIKGDDIYWRYNLKAEHAFVSRENINDLIRRNGIIGEIGILSIDIDGNDYWVWEAIDVIKPSVVIVNTTIVSGRKSGYYTLQCRFPEV